MRYLDRLQPLALFLIRITLGVIMIAHGYQKVFHGLHHFLDMMGGIGMPRWAGYLAAFTEFLGGILVLAGLFTRPVAFAMVIEMFVAIWRVHWHNGLTGNGGFEFPLAVGTLALALIFFGAGPMSFDHVLRGGGGGGGKK